LPIWRRARLRPRRGADARRPRQDGQRRLQGSQGALAHTMHALVARRDVRLLLAGQALSMFGDWAMIVVLGIWAKVLTGASSAAGLVFFVFALAGLVAPVGGRVVDRLPKRPLMIATHVAL